MFATTYVVQNVQGQKLLQYLWILLEIFRKFQTALVLVDVVLMQTQKFFHEYSHGDLTMKALSLSSFVLYGSSLYLKRCKFIHIRES